MKKISAIMFFFLLFMCSAFCYDFSNIGLTYRVFQENRDEMIRELEKQLQPNGCGPAGSSEWLVKFLNWIGDEEACNIHDRDYATLGMSKEKADQRLYDNMYRLGQKYVENGEVSRTQLQTIIAYMYKVVVRNLGDKPYNNAQAKAREYHARQNSCYPSIEATKNYCTSEDSYSYDDWNYAP